ncbi:uncharacterized protein PRD47_012909 isoform 1-T1 [Ara ararauna]
MGLALCHSYQTEESTLSKNSHRDILRTALFSSCAHGKPPLEWSRENHCRAGRRFAGASAAAVNAETLLQISSYGWKAVGVAEERRIRPIWGGLPESLLPSSDG